MDPHLDKICEIEKKVTTVTQQSN